MFTASTQGSPVVTDGFTITIPGYLQCLVLHKTQLVMKKRKKL